MLYTISNIFSGLVVVASFTNTLPQKPKLKSRAILFFIIFLLTQALGARYGQLITPLALSIVGIFIYITQTSKITGYIFGSLGYISSVFLNYIFLFLYEAVLGIPVSSLTGYPLVVFLIIYFLCVQWFSYYLGKFLREKVQIQHIVMSQKINTVILLNLLCCIIIFVVNFIYGEKLDYSYEIVASNFVMFFIYFLLSSILVLYLVTSAKKELEQKAQLDNYKKLEEYTTSLENLYRGLRGFKHDYINILLTLHSYISEEDLNSLRSYFEKTILPTKDYICTSDKQYLALSNIKVLELKGLIFSKLIPILEKGFDIELDIPQEISSLPIDGIDFIRLLGIYLDNAIEAAIITPNPCLRLRMYVGEYTHIITIENSCNEQQVNLSCLSQEGHTTKGDGHGIGLQNARSILNKYPNVIMKMESDDQLFQITLVIEN